MENILIFDHFNLQDLINISNIEMIKKFIYNIDEIYFTNYSDTRNEMLKNKIMEIIKMLDENLQNCNILNKTEISFLYFTKSMSLDKLPDYSKQAEESASKCLKLNPFIADNYNCMAHIIWKKGDISSAINYFEKALEIDQNNKTTLRCLSMITRSKESTNLEEKEVLARMSLDYGKKAIQLDLKDSNSWYVYANACFFKAFTGNTQYQDLKSSLSSYNQAEKTQKAQSHINPDLYYNRGIVQSYLENYHEAFLDFQIAHGIDINLRANINSDNIYEFIIQTYKLIKNECGLKPKKLTRIISTIPINLKSEIPFTLANFDSLKLNSTENCNKGKLISAKILQPLTKIFEVPVSMICIDHNGFFFVLSIFNVSKTFSDGIKFNSSNVTIIDPVYKNIKFELGQKIYEYQCIQTSNLSKILIDGKYCSNFSSGSLLNCKFFN